MQKKKHRAWKKKNLEVIKNFDKINDDRPVWANDEKLEQEDYQWKEKLINEVKQVYKQNKAQEIKMQKGNNNSNQMDSGMLAGLAGLAAYDQMKHFTPAKTENATVIDLSQNKQVLENNLDEDKSKESV